MNNVNTIYKYYLLGQPHTTFPSYNSLMDYLRDNRELFLNSCTCYGWFVVRENRRTHKRVLFEINPLNVQPLKN